MSPTVAVFGSLRFPPEQINAVIPHLKSLVEATYRLDGCVAYDVALDAFDPGLIRFSELWPDHATLDKHLKAAHIEPWRAITKSFGLVSREFTAYDISGARPL